MKILVVAIRDSAVDAFSPPFFVPSTAAAVRSFGDALRDPQGAMGKHPADYTLYQLGEFDEDTGRFTNLDSPQQLVRGQDIKEVAHASPSS